MCYPDGRNATYACELQTERQERDDNAAGLPSSVAGVA